MCTIYVILMQMVHSYMYLTISTGSSVEVDYVPIVTQQLPFTNTDRMQDLTVQIVSDGFTELNETFSVELSSVFLATESGGPAIVLSDQESARLILDPDAADVTILDGDGMQFHFINVLYNMQRSFLVQWLLLVS